MGNVPFCANDSVLRMLAEFHIMVIYERVPEKDNQMSNEGAEDPFL